MSLLIHCEECEKTSPQFKDGMARHTWYRVMPHHDFCSAACLLLWAERREANEREVTAWYAERDAAV